MVPVKFSNPCWLFFQSRDLFLENLMNKNQEPMGQSTLDNSELQGEKLNGLHSIFFIKRNSKLAIGLVI
jgi:hypothetical protein